MRRFTGALVVALLLVAVAPSSANAAAVLSVRNGPERSTNWSGYAVGTNSDEAITEVSGTWVVPRIKAAPPGFSSSWIGIGGYRTPDLIQLGTASSGAIDGDYAWYEMLPDYSIRITGCTGDAACTVLPGDRLTGSIVNTAGDTWLMAMTNMGRGGHRFAWRWTKTVTYASSRSSAEWIFEAPTVGLAAAPVGTQTTPAHATRAKFFGGAYKVNGVTRTLQSGGAQRIVMVPPCVLVGGLGCVNFATPSMLAADGHFAVCTYKQRCANF